MRVGVCFKFSFKTGIALGTRLLSSSQELFYLLLGKKDVLESWPTSPVLHNEETNAREKEKAHKYYERQLKASNWYLQPPQRNWIEIVEPGDNGVDTCSQCYYDDACGCVLVSNHSNVTPARRKSGRSSFGDTLSVESGTRASEISRNSTEDEKSFYDNLCQFCKITSLERRAKKYGEWRRRFSAKLAEARSQDDGAGQQTCTCAMDNLSFIDWKKIYEEEELIKLSKVDHFHENSQGKLSNSDYDTQKSELHSDYGTQKSKDSTSTVVYRDYPSLTIKSSSLGYNSLSSIPYTERDDVDTQSDYTSTDEYEESGNECFDSHAGRTRMHPALRVTRGVSRDDDDEVFSGRNSIKHAKRRRRPRYRNSNSLKTKAHLHKERSSKSQREVIQNNNDNCDTKETSTDNSILDDVENSAKIPIENDETLPPDLLSEFLAIARNIDEFYESVHAKKFLENRTLATSRERVNGTSSSRDHVDVITSSRDKGNNVTSSSRERCDFTTSSSGIDMTSRESIADQPGTELFSAELRKRIRSLERLCSFVEYSDEEESETCLLGDVKELEDTTKDETPVWRLSQQSINLTLSRRNRSGTSSDSSRSRVASTSGSGSSNSRSSTRQGHRKNTKPSITSVENLKSPDSGFSDSLTALNSADSCQLGTKWAGSMQWDYSDWQFYYGVPCDEGQIEMSKDSTGLMTIDEARPQDPLDWDW